MEESSLLGTAAGSLSRKAAERYTRRSLVSKVGRYGIAMTMGWAALDVLDPSDALAHCSQGTACGYQVYNCSSIWCSGNACPAGTCGCGSWCERVSTSTCGDGWRRVADCCGNCNCGGNCNGGCPQHCCNHQTYTNGSCSDCQNNHVNCRRWFCANGSYG